VGRDMHEMLARQPRFVKQVRRYAKTVVSQTINVNRPQGPGPKPQGRLGVGLGPLRQP
jgi:hypothetical protein